VLIAAAALLGVDPAGLEHALTTRSRVMREGVIVSPLNVRSAVENRQVALRLVASCHLVPVHCPSRRTLCACCTPMLQSLLCTSQATVVLVIKQH
jgi:hypothetical protein